MNHDSPKEQFLKRLTHLRKFSASGRKALHKPALLLYALAEFKHRNAETVHYGAAEDVIAPLLEKFGAPGSRARVSDPFARLEGDKIWKLRAANRGELFDAGGNAKPGALRRHNVEAGFDPASLNLLRANPQLIDEAVATVVREHIPADIRDEVLRLVGWSRSP